MPSKFLFKQSPAHLRSTPVSNSKIELRNHAMSPGVAVQPQQNLLDGKSSVANLEEVPKRFAGFNFHEHDAYDLGADTPVSKRLDLDTHEHDDQQDDDVVPPLSSTKFQPHQLQADEMVSDQQLFEQQSQNRIVEQDRLIQLRQEQDLVPETLLQEQRLQKHQQQQILVQHKLEQEYESELRTVLREKVDVREACVAMQDQIDRFLEFEQRRNYAFGLKAENDELERIIMEDEMLIEGLDARSGILLKLRLHLFDFEFYFESMLTVVSGRHY